MQVEILHVHFKLRMSEQGLKRLTSSSYQYYTSGKGTCAPSARTIPHFGAGLDFAEQAQTHSGNSMLVFLATYDSSKNIFNIFAIFI